jgi:hypothetical protein
MTGLLLTVVIVLCVFAFSGRVYSMTIPRWAPGVLVRWHARRRFRAAMADYRRWMREADFVYKVLGEPSEEWRHAVIEQARAERDMNLWGARAWQEPTIGPT